MTRILQFTLLLSLLFTTALVGQISVIEGQNFDIKGQSNEFQISGSVEIEMGDDQTGDFFWELTLDEDIPEEWTYSICDSNTCYFDGVYLCPEDKPNTLDSGNTLTFYIYLKPNETPGGIHNTSFKLFSAADGSVIHTETDISWEVSLASSTEDVFNNTDFALYPNPTSDYFNISNDENVAQVSVYTILGKEMFTFDHEIGQAYSVADLDAGFYLARLIDQNGKSMKVIRFNKNSKN